MRVIGLTGGIASGKSTVTAMFRQLGATLLDADQLAREVVEPGEPALAEIAARFPGVLDGQGRLDRPKLGARIFNNPAERQALNGILHPRIHQRFLDKTRALEAQGVRMVIYDAALLFENRLQEKMNGTLLVSVPVDVQRQRLMARDGLTVEEANARISAQMPLSEKAALATWVVDNSGDLENTRRQVEALWRTLNAKEAGQQ